jgi:hypothetical protein
LNSAIEVTTMPCSKYLSNNFGILLIFIVVIASFKTATLYPLLLAPIDVFNTHAEASKPTIKISSIQFFFKKISNLGLEKASPLFLE